ncbi:MAG: hypothetical protein H6724_17535 [Sandaracinus sp.]|nr:hypothetical protein [Myxococcales bacterium]MCB9621247.1 hypothetical protein [Sandaracinus sp.]MCB9622205.1 hypothetical protein [Sandaracinus sp.]
MGAIWDRTLLPLSCEDRVTEDDLWALHRELWILAFGSLGDHYENLLHDLDANVVVQPQHPELWFYRGRDDDAGLDAVSRSELRYAFAADEFNNPTYEYEVIHHWFRLGLAVAFERAIATAAKRGIRLEVPPLLDELRQSHWRLAYLGSSGGGYGLVHPHGDSYTLFTAKGWQPVETFEASYQESVRKAAVQGCQCFFCPGFRERARSIVERADWEAALTERKATHAGLALFASLLELRNEQEDDPGRFDWAALRFAREGGKTAVLANPSEATETLRPFLETVSPATAPAALAVACAFVAGKSAQRVALLPLVRATLRTPDEEALGRAVRELMPGKFGSKSPVLKKHLDAELLEALATLPDRLGPYAAREERRHTRPLLECVVELGYGAVVDAKPVPGSLDVIRAWLESAHPEVREQVSQRLRRAVAGYSGRKLLPYFQLVVEVARRSLLPELIPVLLARAEDLPEDLVPEVAKKLPTLGQSLDERLLQEAFGKVPALRAPNASE